MKLTFQALNVLTYPVNMLLDASTGPVLGRCWQQRPSTGPVQARYWHTAACLWGFSCLCDMIMLFRYTYKCLEGNAEEIFGYQI